MASENWFSFFEWEIKMRTCSEDMDHNLDDFIFMANEKRTMPK